MNGASGSIESTISPHGGLRNLLKGRLAPTCGGKSTFEQVDFGNFSGTTWLDKTPYSGCCKFFVGHRVGPRQALCGGIQMSISKHLSGNRSTSRPKVDKGVQTAPRTSTRYPHEGPSVGSSISRTGPAQRGLGSASPSRLRGFQGSVGRRVAPIPACRAR